LYLFVSFLFFFQAEDGIRDGHVTGVQTCALPLSRPADGRAIPGNVRSLAESLARLPGAQGQRFAELFKHGTLSVEIYAPNGKDRSEERRVGKECRWWSVGES